jgi:hypothetical protein
VLWHDNGRIEIVFPRMYRYATYVLHELVHYGLGLKDDVAPHGPEFAGMWLALVREFCNQKTSHALERALAREKVKIYIPIISEEEDGDAQFIDDQEIVLDIREEDDSGRDQLELFLEVPPT